MSENHSGFFDSHCI